MHRLRSVAVGVMALVMVGCVEQPAPDASGEEIYLQLCARCHGADLEGGTGPALGPGSTAAEQPDEFLATAITEGRGRMPSFAQTLTDAQVRRVVDYIRTVQDGT